MHLCSCPFSFFPKVLACKLFLLPVKYWVLYLLQRGEGREVSCESDARPSLWGLLRRGCFVWIGPKVLWEVLFNILSVLFPSGGKLNPNWSFRRKVQKPFVCERK